MTANPLSPKKIGKLRKSDLLYNEARSLYQYLKGNENRFNALSSTLGDALHKTFPSQSKDEDIGTLFDEYAWDRYQTFVHELGLWTANSVGFRKPPKKVQIDYYEDLEELEAGQSSTSSSFSG